jgi:hypothetical protein
VLCDPQHWHSDNGTHLLAGDSMGFQNRVELATTLVVRSSTQPPPGTLAPAAPAAPAARKRARA